MMYKIENIINKVHCADCLEFMKEIPEQSIDLIVTDPPYNISGYTQNSITHLGRKKPINLNFGEWDNFTRWEELIFSFKRILKPNGTIYIFVSHNIFGILFKLMNTNFHRTNFYIWNKPNPAIQISKSSYVSSCEFILWSHGQKHTFNFTNQNDMHNIWTGTYPMGNSRYNHPTQKPLKLVEKFIFHSSNEGDVVLDCFAGTGTTLLACKNLHRNFIGIEISPEFCAISEERLRQGVLI